MNFPTTRSILETLVLKLNTLTLPVFYGFVQSDGTDKAQKYIVYNSISRTNAKNFDNRTFIRSQEFQISLFTTTYDPDLEDELGAVLDELIENKTIINYNKLATTPIESEKMYQALFEIKIMSFRNVDLDIETFDYPSAYSIKY